MDRQSGPITQADQSSCSSLMFKAFNGNGLGATAAWKDAASRLKRTNCFREVFSIDVCARLRACRSATNPVQPPTTEIMDLRPPNRTDRVVPAVTHDLRCRLQTRLILRSSESRQQDGAPVPSSGAHMAEGLRTADLDIGEKPAQTRKRVLSMPGAAAEGQDFEQANTPFLAAEKVQRKIGAATRVATSRLTDLYRGGRLHTANSYKQLATTCHSIASGTVRHVRSTKEEHPLRLLGMIAGVAFAAGIAVRIWRSSHE
jgi:hypothetical protein